ncbi:MAG: CPBP family intramembrane metalloprotease [Deltaproteobacteria bacterium]|nr:CPBP family intramembrane metalloprotease [Deltaproteobacteria bacterium]
MAVVGVFAGLMAVQPLLCLVGDLLASFWDLAATRSALRPGVPRPGALRELAPFVSAALLESSLIPVALLGAALRWRPLGATLALAPVEGGWRRWAPLIAAPFAIDAAADSVIALLGLSAPAQPTPGSLGLALELGAGVLLAPIGEELLFRGWILSTLRERWGRTAAIVGTAVAFTVWHADARTAIVVLPAGLAMGWVTERSGSLLPALATHALNNLLAILFGATVGLSLVGHAGVVALGTMALVLALHAIRLEARGSAFPCAPGSA